MIKTILFSPIGGSDPVNAGHDGAWIHCCRFFQPDLTVVYLSAQMLAREERKGMFSETLKRLNKHTGKTIAMEKEERPQIDNPQNFEAFYDDFEDVLTRYHQEYPDAEILINISSGTPAMKSCLTVLYHFLPFPVKLIRVDSPHHELGLDRGRRATVSDDYDVDDNWENNLDNLEDAENRCHIQTVKQHAVRLRITQLKAQLKVLIEHHEYSAARMLAKESELKGVLSDRLISFLEGATARIQMDLSRAGIILSALGNEEGKMIRGHYQDLLYQGAELLMTMEIDLKREDIAACLRKLTPVLFSLIIGCLHKNGIDLLSVTTNEKNKYIDGRKLEARYPELYRRISGRLFSMMYPDTTIMDSGTLMIILSDIVSNQDPVKNCISRLRDIEAVVRVEVAHKPVKMTAALFQSETGIEPEEMLRLAKDAFQKLNPVLFNSSFWDSYSRMVTAISEELQAG